MIKVAKVGLIRPININFKVIFNINLLVKKKSKGLYLQVVCILNAPNIQVVGLCS